MFHVFEPVRAPKKGPGAGVRRSKNVQKCFIYAIKINIFSQEGPLRTARTLKKYQTMFHLPHKNQLFRRGGEGGLGRKMKKSRDLAEFDILIG